MIGTTWMSKQGQRTVADVQPHSRTGVLTAFIITDGERFAMLLPAEQVPDEIRRDTTNLGSHQKALAREAEVAAMEAEKEDLNGFDDDMTPIKRGKAVAALTKKIRTSMGMHSVRDTVRMAVNQGAHIQIARDGKRRFIFEDGRFWVEKDFGKLAFDYAEFLISMG